MVEPVETLDGWYVLHDLRKVDWQKWHAASEAEREAALEEWQQIASDWQSAEGSHGLYEVIGHKGDWMFLILRPTLDELLAAEKQLDCSLFAQYLVQTTSYFSIVELAKYRPNLDENHPEVQERLYPDVPDWPYISFYPMSRRRSAEENWYTLEHKDRSKLLYEHSLTGRKYAGKVKQMISGSIGLDLYEWGVTLFAHDALDLKKIVYEMRFDEVTARYGEFADFYIGKYVPIDRLIAVMER